MTSAPGGKRRAWQECLGNPVRGRHTQARPLHFGKTRKPGWKVLHFALCHNSLVAKSLHVADFPAPAGGDQPAGATSCWTGGMCGGITQYITSEITKRCKRNVE